MMKSKIVYQVSRMVMALLFVFSGLTKAINPFGLSVQIGEYFSAMGLDFLKPLAGVGGIVLPSVEMLIGLMLLVGLSRRLAAWATMLFMSFFTVLTLWIALTNPVNDCGCFGDVVKLSNWATLIKNIVLMPFAIVVFVNRHGGQKQIRSCWYFLIVPLSFTMAVYCYYNLPIVDATPYKIGINIAEQMALPGDQSEAESHTLLVYRNVESGQVREFEIEDTEWQDESRWEYVDTKTTVISEGAVPAIRNLPMIDADGVDKAPEVLAVQGRVMIVVTNRFDLQEIKKSEKFARGLNVEKFVVLTSTAIKLTDYTTDYRVVYLSDHTVISTMIQNSRGGALLLENGVIVKKYVMRQIVGE